MVVGSPYTLPTGSLLVVFQFQMGVTETGTLSGVPPVISMVAPSFQPPP